MYQFLRSWPATHLLRRARCLRVETGWIPVQAASFVYKMHPWLNGTVDRSYVRVVVDFPGMHQHERRSAMAMSAHPALVLNADFRPMSVPARPLHLPVLRRGVSIFGADVRARHSAVAR